MSYHLRVKICGITRLEDLETAAEAGADAIGLNFHPPSPRSLSQERAEVLLHHLPPFVEAVGVFVRRKVGELAEIRNLGRISTLQIHGGPAEVVQAFPFHYIPAFQVRDRADLDLLGIYLAACHAAGLLPSAILVDGHAPNLAGGTGVTAPWDLLADFHPGVPLLLAGGLTPDNVAEAVRKVRPWGVDVASGVESSPGVKDASKVRRFIEAARQAAAMEWPPTLSKTSPSP